MSFTEAVRLKGVPFSGIRAIFERASKLEKAGRTVIHMELGRPDFDTPAHIKTAAEEALQQGQVHYTSNYGLIELRQAIAAKLQRDNGLNYDSKDEVLVTVGVAEAVYLAMAAYLEAGDEVIVPEPSWVNYLRVPSLLDARVVSVPLLDHGDFGLDVAKLERQINPRTRMLVIISPHNPTGGMLEPAHLEALATVAQKHNLLVLSDEIYEKITYDGHRHVSIASLPGMRERTILLNGFSKAYSMTGWRLGYAATTRALMKPLVRVHQYLNACACSFAQAGAVEALNGPQDCVEQMVAEFQRRRDIVVDQLNAIPGVTCKLPAGAFYVFADVSSYSSLDKV